MGQERLSFLSRGLTTAGLLLLLVSLFVGCLSGAMPVNPIYATRSNRTISGEIALGEVEQLQNRYGAPGAMGAVELAVPVAGFCEDSLQQELESFGFNITDKAPLRVDAKVLQADTVWQQQGRGGVFKSTFALEFALTDADGSEVYRQIHQGSASHSQSYGGYPASASVVDALATAYERFLKDARLQEVLVASRSVNLYGEASARAEERIDYKNQIFRDYPAALEAIAPDLIAYMSGDKFDSVYAIFGFKNRENRRNQLSVEVERDLRSILSRERFQIVTREIDEIIEEQKLQLSGLFDENKRVEIGQLVGADQLITGSLYHYPDDGLITLRIEVVGVESGLVGASFVTNLIAGQGYVEMVSAEP